jgi:transcriptional regulator with XRE-family HTH domain
MVAKMQRAERNLRALAAAAGFKSLRLLAHESGVDRMTIRLALRGLRRPHRSTVERLAAALHADVGLVEQVFEGARTDLRAA